MLYTSELKEIQLACDRAIVIFGGRVVAELDAAGADEAALLRAAHNLPGEDPRSDAATPPGSGPASTVAEAPAGSGAADAVVEADR
jgi:hypothetical protein